MSAKTQKKIAKLQDRIHSFKSDLTNALSNKKNGTREISLSKTMAEIEKLQNELRELQSL